MSFTFSTAGRIIFGAGAISQVPALAAALGQRPLLVTGRGTERAAPLRPKLEEQGLSVTALAVAGEPTTDVATWGVEQARAGGCDLVIGLGGGSVIDTAKAVAALLKNGGEPLDYLEVIGRGKPLTEPAAPCIAVPTTAGTGSEVTHNAVLKSVEHGVKVSLRSPLLLPKLAVIDPQLTLSLPPAVTASTGLDALTQVLEPYVSRAANPLTDAICREGLQRAARSLGRAFRDGSDEAARYDMAVASLFGGLALASSKLGAAHGFAGPLGGMYDAPHGVICARILPFAVEVNVRALSARAPEAPARRRFDEVAALLTGRPEATAADGVAWLRQLCDELAVPPLSRFGLERSHFAEIIPKVKESSSMKGNPIELTEDELTEILDRALGC